MFNYVSHYIAKLTLAYIYVTLAEASYRSRSCRLKSRRTHYELIRHHEKTIFVI